MKIISQSTMNSEELAEYSARICYNSTDKMGKNPNFLDGIIKRGHLSVLEHWSVTVALATEELNEYNVLALITLITFPGIIYRNIGFTHYITLNHRHLIEFQDYKLIKEIIEELNNES